MTKAKKAKLKSYIAAITEEEAVVNIRPRYRGILKGNYLIGHKRTGASTAKRVMKLLIEWGLI